MMKGVLKIEIPIYNFMTMNIFIDIYCENRIILLFVNKINTITYLTYTNVIWFYNLGVRPRIICCRHKPLVSYLSTDAKR